MTVKEMMERVRKDGNDVDFIDNYDERALCAYCGTKLTEEGEREFADALALEIDEENTLYEGLFNDNLVKKYGEQVVVKCNTEKDARCLNDLLKCMAGYCGEDDYDKWFSDDDDEEEKVMEEPKAYWMRVGVKVMLTKEELERMTAKLLLNKLNDGSAIIDGNAYIPTADGSDTVAEWCL